MEGDNEINDNEIDDYDMLIYSPSFIFNFIIIIKIFDLIYEKISKK